MNLSLNKWHYHLAALLAPLGLYLLIIMLLISNCNEKSILFQLVLFVTGLFQLISIVSQVLYMIQIENKKVNISLYETIYCYVVFIFSLPIYIAMGLVIFNLFNFNLF